MAEYQREMVLTMLLAAYLVYLASRSAVTETVHGFLVRCPFVSSGCAQAVQSVLIYFYPSLLVFMAGLCFISLQEKQCFWK